MGEDGYQKEELWDKGKRGEGQGSRGDEVMGAVDDEGWNKFARTVDWASPIDVCAKMGWFGQRTGNKRV